MKSDTEILVISGMSGAGKSTIAHTLEDLGWYVVDNWIWVGMWSIICRQHYLKI